MQEGSVAKAIAKLRGILPNDEEAIGKYLDSAVRVAAMAELDLKDLTPDQRKIVLNRLGYQYSKDFTALLRKMESGSLLGAHTEEYRTAFGNIKSLTMAIDPILVQSMTAKLSEEDWKNFEYGARVYVGLETHGEYLSIIAGEALGLGLLSSSLRKSMLGTFSRNRPVSLGANLIGEGDPAEMALKWVKPQPGQFDVIVHGGPDKFYVLHNGVTVELDHRSLATFIKKNGYDGNTTIRLLSCSTGCNTGTAAQNLSNKLGVKVVAPSDTLWIYSDGRIIVAPKNSFGGPDLSKLGEMRTFNPVSHTKK